MRKLLSELVALALSVLLLGVLSQARAAQPFVPEGTLETGTGPNVSAVALGGKLLVVANSDSEDISLIELETQKIRPRIHVGRVPSSLAISPDGKTAYVGCFSGMSLAIVDLVNETVIRSVDLGVHPHDVIRMGNRLLVSGYYEGLLLSLDAETGDKVASLDLGVGLHHLTPHPDGKRFYLLKTSRSEVYEIAVEPLTVLSKLDEELEWKGTWDFVLSRDGSRLVISQWNGNRVAVLSTGPLKVEGFVETGGEGPCALDLAPDGRHLVVAHSESDDAAIVDIVRLHLRAVLPVGNFPFSDVLITEDSRYALVTADNVRKLAILDLSSDSRVGEVATGKIPHAITAGPGGMFYVSNTGATTVTVIRRRFDRELRFEVLHQE